MKTFLQHLAEAAEGKPGTFAHFAHHVRKAGEAEEAGKDETMWSHHDELQKHYKPHPNYSRGTGLLDLDLGDHHSSEKDLRHAYAKSVSPKGKTSSKNYGTD